jgi:hypothetical protein
MAPLGMALAGVGVIALVAGCTHDATPTVSRSDDQSHSTGGNTSGGSTVSHSVRYPKVVTGYGGPLLSLPDTGSFDWLCTGPTGATRRFHIRYTAVTNEQVVVVERGGPPLRYRADQLQLPSIITPAQSAGSQTWSVRFGGENGTTNVKVRFQFAVIGGACIVQRTDASRRFTSNSK